MISVFIVLGVRVGISSILLVKPGYTVVPPESTVLEKMSHVVDINVTPHNEVEGSFMDASRFHAQEGRLEGPQGSGTTCCQWW